MHTYTPRTPEGKFESWNTKTQQAGQYGAQDALIVAGAAAAGAAVVAVAPAAWEMLKDAGEAVRNWFGKF